LASRLKQGASNLAVLAALIAGPAQAEFSVAGRLQHSTVRKDERAVLELEIVWGEADLVTEVSEPTVPKLEGLVLTGRSVAERSEITAAGLPIHRRLYRFELRPTDVGKAQVGASEVSFSLASGASRSLRSAPLALEVVAAPHANLMPAWFSLAALILVGVAGYIWWQRHPRGRLEPPPDPLRTRLEQARSAAQSGDRARAGDAIYGVISDLLKARCGVVLGADPELALTRSALEEGLRTRLREVIESLRAARYGGLPADLAALEQAERVAQELLSQEPLPGRQ
jgi:hypothetical protein